MITLPPVVVGHVTSFLCYKDFRGLEVTGIKIPESHWVDFGTKLLTQLGYMSLDAINPFWHRPFVAKVASRRVLHMRWLANRWQRFSCNWLAWDRGNRVIAHGYINEVDTLPTCMCTLQAIKDSHMLDFFMRLSMFDQTFEGMTRMRRHFVQNYSTGENGPRDAVTMIGEIDFPTEPALLEGTVNVPSLLTVLCFSRQYLFYPSEILADAPRLVYTTINDQHDITETHGQLGQLEPHFERILGGDVSTITHWIILGIVPVDFASNPYGPVFFGNASASAYIKSTGKIIIEILYEL